MNNEEFYTQKLAQHGDSIQAVGWDDEHRAVARYMLVNAQLLHYNVSSVLDYGCGLCHFHDYLFPGIAYTGYDINKAYIDQVLKSKPKLMVSSQLLNWQHDAIVCIGTFSLMYGFQEQEFIDYVMRELTIMKMESRVTILTILWKPDCDYCDDKLYYFDWTDLSYLEHYLTPKRTQLLDSVAHEKILIFEW